MQNLALEAGTLTLQGYGQTSQVLKEGPDGYDISTEYDMRAEDLIKSRLLKEFGEPVLGEEDGLSGDLEAARRALWIVDPIDGTFNYQRGLPLYAVSLAFCEEGVPVCAAVALPALGQLYYARQGAGAFVVDGAGAEPQPLRVGRERALERLVVSVAGSGTFRLLAACQAEGVPWRSLRLLMGAVPSLSFLARGRLDVFLDTSLKLWDCASGDLLVREAGGPALANRQAEPLFPQQVWRRLDGHDVDGFVCVGASGRDLIRGLATRIVAAAGV